MTEPGVPKMSADTGELLGFDAARTSLRRLLEPLPCTHRRLDRVRGCRLAEDIVSAVPLPPFDNTAMDGYAVSVASLRGLPGSIALSEAHPIWTGMPIPDGADAVVPIERIRVRGDRLEIDGPVQAGDHIRRAGEELARGSSVLEAGARLTPAAVGLLAAIGLDSVPVIPRPRVAVLVTGDELAEPGQELVSGQIYDADGPLLRALLEEAGGEIVASLRLPDDPLRIGRALKRLARRADLVCTSGGASVGGRDHLIGQLGNRGSVSVHQLAVKPGRPTSMGIIDGTPVFVLPGNPLALLVGFEVLVRPAVRLLAGEPDLFRPRVRAIAHEAIAHGDRLELLPVRLLPGPPLEAVVAHRHGSAMLSGAAVADGLAILDAGRGTIGAGEWLEVERWVSPDA